MVLGLNKAPLRWLTLAAEAAQLKVNSEDEDELELSFDTGVDRTLRTRNPHLIVYIA